MGLSKSKKSTDTEPPKKRVKKVKESVPEPEPEETVDEEDRPDAAAEEEVDGEPDAGAKMLARRRGYRAVAKKGGFSAAFDSGFSHLDVAVPILSEAEVIRACKWAPKLADKSAYDNIEEFEERSRLQFESLPPSAARVIRAHSEAYLRRLVVGVMQRASDAQKPRVTMMQVAAELRPLQRIQKYTFVAPTGLVRYSQNEAPIERLSTSVQDEDDQTKKDEKVLLKKQKSAPARLAKDKDKEKADAEAIKAERLEARNAGRDRWQEARAIGLKHLAIASGYKV